MKIAIRYIIYIEGIGNKLGRYRGPFSDPYL